MRYGNFTAQRSRTAPNPRATPTRARAPSPPISAPSSSTPTATRSKRCSFRRRELGTRRPIDSTNSHTNPRRTLVLPLRSQACYGSRKSLLELENNATTLWVGGAFGRAAVRSGAIENPIISNETGVGGPTIVYREGMQHGLG